MASPAPGTDRREAKRSSRTSIGTLGEHPIGLSFYAVGFFPTNPPFIVDGVVPPLSTWPRADVIGSIPIATAREVLSGVPGSPGSVTGVARIVLDPADPYALQPGEILVAPITDPAWTPMFVAAAGVVVNVGAQVSHAVIVSRELGLPCVVSVHGATVRIPDGALVTVDGSAGTVTLV